MESNCSAAMQFREFDILTRLFSTIPKYVRSMFGTRQEFTWTSIDVSDKFFIIGTNVGVVFVYDRAKAAIKHELSYQVTVGNKFDIAVNVGAAALSSEADALFFAFVFNVPFMLPLWRREIGVS
jgi:hypothetical protein